MAESSREKECLIELNRIRTSAERLLTADRITQKTKEAYCCRNHSRHDIWAENSKYFYRPRFSSAASTCMGVTTWRATSGERRKDRNTSGQQGNKFNTSYGDISVIVAENNSVVKPKYQQYTSLHKMLSSKSFTAVINNGGIGKGIGGIRKGTKKNYIYVL